ncbi:hypothetical protein NEOLEDRAFT_1143967 [Neolentinus lepideus HHB14362 ss-1]|uniref:Uncharacterized protein n=1 Tax=Neolentinus lepideus HHB14362 ss-1 TaxID=1314782 RepID=A0A165M689_9AGAM|nr:hypothetical protein NEOLEDRAFT_1143967 [Neolentinus lepideus HHB14362 ss-1]
MNSTTYNTPSVLARAGRDLEIQCRLLSLVSSPRTARSHLPLSPRLGLMCRTVPVVSTLFLAGPGLRYFIKHFRPFTLRLCQR